MRRLALLALLLLSACAEPVPLAAPAVAMRLPVTTSAPTVIPDAPDTVGDAVVAAVRGASRPDTEVGLLVVDLKTGAELASVNADRRFRSASLSKLLMAIDALRRGTAGRDDVHTMLSLSDDQIANVLWMRAGGPSMVTETATRLGLTGTTPPALPNRWGDVLMTPADLVRVYQHIRRIPLIMDALASAPAHAADGFYQHFGLPDGLSAPVAVKQGWSDDPDDLSVHSTGVVAGRYVVVLLTEHPRPISLQIAAESVTAGARVLDRLLT